jgi:hypothetical protein
MTLIMSQYNDPCDPILPLMSQYNNASKYHNPILFLISQYNNGSSVASDGTIENYLLCTNKITLLLSQCNNASYVIIH